MLCLEDLLTPEGFGADGPSTDDSGVRHAPVDPVTEGPLGAEFQRELRNRNAEPGQKVWGVLGLHGLCPRPWPGLMSLSALHDTQSDPN
jgi:hypothetical protein